MELAEWCSSSRVIIVAGKGGVGKTTSAAALAVAAVRAGRRALLVELEGKSGLGSMFGVGTISGETEVYPGLTVLPLAPDEALLEYLESHGLRRMSKRLVHSGALDIVATAVPGMKEILVLGKVKALQRAGAADVIIVDGPAAGHAVTFLLSPKGLLDAVRVGPVLTQAVEVTEMLADPDRAQVMLVTLPEETPVNETAETAEAFVDRIGLTLGPLVVNGVYPDRPLDRLTTPEAVRALAERAGAGRPVPESEVEQLARAARFLVRRRGLQEEQLGRLADRLELPQVVLPFLFSSDIGPAELEVLADALTAGVGALPVGA
ncbi:MAG TPA: ArsA-related P-loop ATPase [Acidimicrobiales bacterium]|nr:ArsA-related P-loop ATPase [Acidimicrobiales bacterium]